MVRMILDKNEIHKMKLHSLVPYTNTCEMNMTEFMGKAGDSYYKLLAYMSSQCEDGKICIDLCTNNGSSALAMSYNPNVKVLSFDQAQRSQHPVKENIEYHIDTTLFSEEWFTRWKDTLLESSFIFIDIEPHNGDIEYLLYRWLEKNEYKGVIVYDDIWYFKTMRDGLWYKIPTNVKEDVTDIAHWSGTGIIDFSLNKQTDQSWTLVTAYFDLTKMPDASASIKGRPAEHYLHHANATLALDYPMVIFCEPENVELIKSKRPVWLQEKTKYIPMSFEEFPYTKYRNTIIENRKRNPYRFDDRNTASYYLFCMSRYAMCKKIMDANPFNTERFAWINICIERMGYKNLIELDHVFSARRDKVSTCYIDYVPRELTLNAAEYFKNGGKCSLCSGFFTGRKDYFYRFCNAIERQFLKYLEEGYGHADEQLFSPVYFENRDIFEVYYGDYTEMITNYNFIKDRAGEPLRLLIRGSYNHNDIATCLPACKKLWESVKKGYAQLNGHQIEELIKIYRFCLESEGLGSELA
jgi:hypothetical protein